MPNTESNYEKARRLSDPNALPGMQSARWGYTRQQGEEEQAGLDKMRNVVEKHPLPKDYSVHTDVSGFMGQAIGKTTLNHATEGEVGSVIWDPETGYVAGFDIASPHRAFASHMLLDAHEKSIAKGSTGPSTATSLSPDSYRMMKRQVPSLIDYQRTSVAGFPASSYEAMGANIVLHLRAAGEHLRSISNEIRRTYLPHVGTSLVRANTALRANDIDTARDHINSAHSELLNVPEHQNPNVNAHLEQARKHLAAVWDV